MSEGKDSLDLSGLGAALPNAAELSSEDKAYLVASIKNTLEGLAMRHMVRKRVEKLREIQGQHDELEAKFFEERAALEAKYQKLYEPLYSKRYEIVNGVIEVEGVTESADETLAEQKSADETPAEQKVEKGVPAFWLNAMKNHEILAEEIQERDEEALKYLKDIKWFRISEPKGLKLEFHFDTNPFFKNSLLTKIYHMIDEDGPIVVKSIGTEIEWYPGKCLTQKVLKMKPRKESKNTKPITKTEDCDSFFYFFSPPQVPDDDEEIDEDTDLQSQMEQDYDIGSTIRDKIIPHAVSWFTGEAAQDDDFEGLVGDEDDDEDDEDDEDEEDEGQPGDIYHLTEVSESSNNLNQDLQNEKSARANDVKSALPKFSDSQEDHDGNEGMADTFDPPPLNPEVPIDVVHDNGQINVDMHDDVEGVEDANFAPLIIPELPADIMGLIFSKLDIYKVVSMGVLCPTFQKAWRFYPHLTFDMGRRPSDAMVEAITLTLMKREVHSLRSLTLGGVEEPLTDGTIEAWCASLADKQSKKFSLSIHLDHFWHLPHSVFNLQNLTALSLSKSIITIADTFYLRAVKMLSLSSCKFLEPSINCLQLFLSMCPSIQILHIKDPLVPNAHPYLTTIINSDHLNSLALSLGFTSLDWIVIAPNLQNMSIGTQLELHSNFFTQFKHVAGLSFTTPNLLGPVAVRFEHLLHLSVENYTDDDLGWLFNFLQNCPALEQLLITSTDTGVYREGDEFWVMFAAMNLPRKLRVLIIKEFLGTFREFCLLNFFLENLSLVRVCLVLHKDMVNILHHSQDHAEFLEYDPLGQLKDLSLRYPEIAFEVIQ